MLGVQGNEIADEIARGGSVLMFVGPEPGLGVSSHDTRKISRWLDNQHWVWSQGLCDTQRQARELISGRCLSVKTRLLSFNRTQFRAVIGLLTGHNTLRRHLHLMGMSDSPLLGGVDQTMKPLPTLFVSVKLWLHSGMRIWAPFSWSQRTLRV
jgi:hypothetical protein